MAGSVTYHIGGYLPDAPAHNKMNEYDTDAGTYTEWDGAGTQTSTRALTVDEIAALTPPEVSAIPTVDIGAMVTGIMAVDTSGIKDAAAKNAIEALQAAVLGSVSG